MAKMFLLLSSEHILEPLVSSGDLCNSSEHFDNEGHFETSDFLRQHPFVVSPDRWGLGDSEFFHKIWEPVHVHTSQVQVFTVLVLCGLLQFAQHSTAQNAFPAQQNNKIKMAMTIYFELELAEVKL